MQMPEPTYPQVGDSAVATIKRLVQQQPEALHDIRQQARFLCGLSSPLLVRKRLTRDAAYGCCAAVPFEDVLDALTAASY